jgi:H+/Cl- antiporter ClcA
LVTGVEYWTHGQGEEVAAVSSEVGSKLVIAGGAIAVFSVVGGLCGLVESIHHWHLENVQVYLGLAFGGGIVGLIMVIFGKTAEEQNGPRANLERCQRCGSQLTGNSKTCKYCGADLK